MMESSEGALGPYRVVGPLGEGGMGEVVKAYDPRLDREVAIKRVRASELGADHRRRFEREARITASLDHPGIVRIFDILTVEGDPHLVMELLPGPSLRQRLEGGSPLAVSEGLPLVRQICDALEHAHQRGVVHRDLKTENVLLDAAGNAKIVDFGIARQRPVEHRKVADVTLTSAGQAPGTARAMAPEVARGEEATPRSDLFSLGVLLYELFTGISPFKTDSHLGTLLRILNEPHEPASSHHRLPEALQDLIDQLLEKEPELRPRNAAEVLRKVEQVAVEGGHDRDETALPVASSERGRPSLASAQRGRQSAGRWRDAPAGRGRRGAAALAGLLLIAAALGWQARRPPPELIYVAVPAPRVEGELDGDLRTLLGQAVRGAVQRTVVSLEGLSPRSFSEVDAVSGENRDVIAGAAADELATAELVCEENGCAVELSRVRGEDQAVLWRTQFEILPQDLAIASRAVSQQLRRAYPGHRQRPGTSELAVDAADFREFLELYRAYHGHPEVASLDRIDQRLGAMRRSSPRFLDAWLLGGEIALGRFFEHRDEAGLHRALARADRAANLAPGDPAPLILRLRAEIAAGELQHAAATLARIEEMIPGDTRLLSSRAELLEAQGEPRLALAQLEELTARRPSWNALFNLAWMAQRQGEIELARRSLGELLERAPDHYEGMSLLAQVELVNGDAAVAAELYQRLLERSQGPVELSNLALARTLLGQHAEAAVAYQEVVDQSPDNPFFLLNLADARSLLGQDEEAAHLYRQVLAALDTGAEPELWQELTVRAQALAHLGRQAEAVLSAQRALQLAPENGQVAFEVALVYTVVGDLTAATVNARRAIDLGFERGWFRLPWFSAIEDRLETPATDA